MHWRFALINKLFSGLYVFNARAKEKTVGGTKEENGQPAFGELYPLAYSFARGPIKGYSQQIQSRLYETELLLLRILPLLAPSQLQSDLSVEAPPDPGQALDGLTPTGSSSPIHQLGLQDDWIARKCKQNYWQDFPLQTPDQVQKWQEDMYLFMNGRRSPGLARVSQGSDAGLGDMTFSGQIHSVSADLGRSRAMTVEQRSLSFSTGSRNDSPRTERAMSLSRAEANENDLSTDASALEVLCEGASSVDTRMDAFAITLAPMMHCDLPDASITGQDICAVISQRLGESDNITELQDIIHDRCAAPQPMIDGVTDQNTRSFLVANTVSSTFPTALFW